MTLTVAELKGSSGLECSPPLAGMIAGVSFYDLFRYLRGRTERKERQGRKSRQIFFYFIFFMPVYSHTPI
jgi:hypothetical protein